MTVPPSALGDPIEAGVFNTSNWSEEISLVSNKGLEVDDDMLPAPKNVPLVETPYYDTLFEGHTWGWDGINRRAVVAQNQNEPSFKNYWIPKILSCIDIFLHLPVRASGFEQDIPVFPMFGVTSSRPKFRKPKKLSEGNITGVQTHAQ